MRRVPSPLREKARMRGNYNKAFPLFIILLTLTLFIRREEFFLNLMTVVLSLSKYEGIIPACYYNGFICQDFQK